jgi:mxaA protein
MRALVLALAMIALRLSAADAASPTVRIDEPRPYGHLVGDVVVREVQIELPPGRTLASDALPRPGRIDNWLELRALRLEPRGGALALRLEYQVINVGAATATTVLPALRLPLAGGAPGESVEIGDWPLHLSPLIPATAVARAALEEMQPDVEPLPEPLAPIAARLAACAALGVLLSLPWWLRRYPQLAFWRRRAPFRRAWSELGAMRNEPIDAALVRLHAAFDTAAGCAVFAGRTEPLYAAQPALRAASVEIDAFFAASRRRFFANETPALSVDSLRVFALRLARLETASDTPVPAFPPAEGTSKT